VIFLARKARGHVNRRLALLPERGHGLLGKARQVDAVADGNAFLGRETPLDQAGPDAFGDADMGLGERLQRQGLAQTTRRVALARVVFHMKDMRHAFAAAARRPQIWSLKPWANIASGLNPRMILRSSQTVSACSQLDTTMT
jgi:hypothetical protein